MLRTHFSSVVFSRIGRPMPTDMILDFWNERAVLGTKAGTDDVIGAELERRAILAHLRPGMHVLDCGCGTGETARAAAALGCDVTGWDYSEEMIAAAQAAGDCGVKYAVHDVRDLSCDGAPYDAIYTQRCLINLATWEEQEVVIRHLLSLLQPGGEYLMCECSVEGLAGINELRGKVGLPAIQQRWHNRYLEDDLLISLADTLDEDLFASLEDFEYPLSTYALLSRVINASLAAQELRRPCYDAPVNRLALDLPAIGSLGQNRLWVWRRL